MARVRAQANPVLLSSTGRRVERVELRFPLKVTDLDDVQLNTTVPDANGVITPIQAGDALIWNAEKSVFEPGSVSLLNAFGAGGFLSQVSDSAKLQVKDSGIYPRGVTLGGIDTDETSPTFGQNIVLTEFPAEGTLLFPETATQDAVFSPGYPYTLPEWERIDIINFGNNLNVEVQQDSGSGQVTAQIDAGDPVIAAYLNGGLSQELPDGQLSVGGPTSLTVSELDFIGDNWSLDPVPAITPGATTGEKINIRFNGGNITTSSPEVLEVLGGFKASVNFSGTQISVNTDLSLYDNSVTKFGEQVFVKDTGDKVVYWPDAVGAASDDGLLPDSIYSDPNEMKMGIGTDDPGARMEIALKKGTTSGIFDIKDYNDAQLKLSNANMFEEANEYATFKIDDRGWLYIRNTSTRVWPDTNTLDLAPAEDYTTAGPQSLSTDQEADGQTLAHISLHAKNQIRLHADSGIFKFFNKEHWVNGAAGQMTDPATARHPHFQIKTTLWTGETILWSNDGRAQKDEQQWFQDGADQTSWRSNLTLRAHGDIRLNAYSGDFYLTGMFEGHPRMSLKVHDHHKEHGKSELGVWYKKTNATAANDSVFDKGMQIRVESLGQTTIRTTEATGESVYAANRGTTDDSQAIVGAKGAAMHFETKGNYYFDGAPGDNGYSVNFREYVSAETTVDYRRIAYMYIHPTGNSGLYFPPRQSSSANGALYQASGDTGIYLITNAGPLYIDSAGDLDIEGGTVKINSVDGLININHNKIGDSGNNLNFLQWATSQGGLTLSSEDNIYLTPAGGHDIFIPSNIGLVFDGSGNNIIESNGTNLTLTTIGDINLTATSDVNIPANVGLTFGNDGEKIEGDGTDLAIDSSGNLNITATLTTINGNLTVTGTTTTVNTTNTTVTDTLLELNQGYSGSGQDSGLILQRGSAGNDALFIWDHSRTGFAFGTTTSGPTDTGNLNITLANIYVEDIIIADGAQIGSDSDPDAIVIASDGGVTFSQSVTVEGDISANGNIDGDGSTNITDINQLEVSQIYGYDGDTDTRILFTDDDINITVGNVNMIDFTQDSTNEITFNEAAADVDVRMESTGKTHLFYLDAGNDFIGIGTSTQIASSILTVGGTLNSTSLVISNGGNIGSVSDTDAMSISSGGVVTFSQIPDVPNNSFALGTDTTGNYVATISDSGTGGITVSGSGSETATVTLELDINGLSAATIASGDFIAFSDEGATGDPTKKESIDDVAALFAGDGLAASSAVIGLDISGISTTATGIQQADFLAFSDEDVAGDPTKKITFSNFEDTIFGNVSGDIAIASGGTATIQANSVALGTDTTGAYVASITTSSGSGLVTTGSGSETAEVSQKLDINDLNIGTIASGDTIAFSDEGTAGDPTMRDTIDDVATLFAGDGLAASQAVIKLDISGLSSTKTEYDDDDFIALSDETAVGDPTKKISMSNFLIAIAGTGMEFASGGGDAGGLSINVGEFDGIGLSHNGVTDFLDLDLNDLTETQIQTGDFIGFADVNDSNITKKETIDDVATLFAGAGLTASSAVMAVGAGNGITVNANDIEVAAAQTTITSLFATDIKIGEDDQTKIDFGDPNEIKFACNNQFQIKLKDGILQPLSDSDVDLGLTGNRFKDAYVDSVTVTGNVTLDQDDAKIVLGTGNDTEIYQSGSETIIKDSSTGNIKLRAGTLTVLNGNATKTMAIFNGANDVELRYNDTKKFATLNTGAEIVGTLKLANGSTGPGAIHIHEDSDTGSNYAGFTVGNMTEDTVYTLPTAYPASNKILQSTSSGVLSWEDASGLITGIANGADNRLTYWSGSSTLQGNSNITISSDSGITMSGTLQAEHVHSTDDISTAATGKVLLDGSSGHSYLVESSADIVDLYVGGDNIIKVTEATQNKVEIKASYLEIDEGERLYFDGGSGTYMSESGDDFGLTVGGTRFLYIGEGGGGAMGSSTADHFTITSGLSNGIGVVIGTDAPSTNSATKSDLTIYHDTEVADLPDAKGGIMIINTHSTMADANLVIGSISFNSADNGGNTIPTDAGEAMAAISVHTIGALDASNQAATMRFHVKAASTAYNANNTERMRLENDGDLHVDADVIAYSSTTSDIRLKHDIKPLESSLSIISQLNPVTYKWKHRKEDTKDHIGLIAQEVEKVVPSIINESKMPFHTEKDDDSEYKSVRYTELIPHLIGAIKEQQSQIEELKEEINKLKNK